MSTPTLRDLAEDAYAYLPLQQHVRKVEFEDLVVRVGAVNNPHGTMILRVRSTGERFPALFEEVRAWLRAHDRVGAMWWVGPTATPSDLAERLEAEGLVPYESDPVFAGMTCEREPPSVDGVDVRPVETLDDIGVLLEVSRSGWGMSDDVFEQVAAAVRTNWPKRDPTLDRLWLAYVDGEPVGTAVSQYMGSALYLGGSTVVPEARGRGVYRAMVRRRWDDARERGATAMVIQAGAMSRPVVERLGFEHVCDVNVYVDSL